MSEIALITAIAANALTALKNARELATATSNSELKEQLSSVYNDLLTLREKLLDVVEDNRTLSAQLNERKKVDGPSTPYGYFFMVEDTKREHPLCPVCYQTDGTI